jgi:large subunit ribosomal protein L24e
MPKCVYCGKIYEFPRGLTLVMKDGTINYLCSPKCKKNMLMKRRKVEWVRKSDTTKNEEAKRTAKK